MLAKTSLLAGVVIGATLFAGRARAQTETEPEAKPHAADAMGEGGEEQLTLPKGRLVLNAFFEINLSDSAAFKPFSISPDLWYGATDEITVGLVHSALGTTGFMGGIGTYGLGNGDGLCLSGSGDGGCADVYPGFGLEGRYKLKPAFGFTLAADGGLYVRHISDPIELSIKIGALGRWHKDKLAVEINPSLLIGLTNRTQSETAGGVTVDLTLNDDILFIPGTVLYTVAPQIDVMGQTGFFLPLEHTGDTYAIPLSVGASYHLNESVNLTLALSLPRLIASSSGGQTGFDARVLTLGGNYAF
jgi:hypothetical protein